MPVHELKYVDLDKEQGLDADFYHLDQQSHFHCYNEAQIDKLKCINKDDKQDDENINSK